MKLMPARYSLTLLAGVFAVFTATNASATTTEWYPGGSGFTGWPTNWIAIASLNDPVGLSAANARLDFVGDAQNPGAYWSANSNYFFIRMRVAVSNVTSTTFRDAHWIYIDRVDFTNGAAAPNMPDYAIAWDSKNNDLSKHGLELQTGTNLSATAFWSQMQLNDSDGLSNDKAAPPDFNMSGNGYIRTIDMRPTTNFGYTTYIDFAVNWSFIRANTALNTNQEWRLQFGSRNDSTDHNFPQDDIAGGFSAASPVASSWGVLPLSHPLSATIGFSVFAASTNVYATLSTVNETGYGDIVVYVWQADDWKEIGSVPSQPIELQSAEQQSYYIPLSGNGLTVGSSYYFKVVDEAGIAHIVTQTVAVRAVKVLAVQLELETVAMTFETEMNRKYMVMGSSDLVTWTPELVMSPTYNGWSELADTPFTAGPGSQTQVLVPKNERARAFFKPERVDW